MSKLTKIAIGLVAVVVIVIIALALLGPSTGMSFLGNSGLPNEALQKLQNEIDILNQQYGSNTEFTVISAMRAPNQPMPDREWWCITLSVSNAPPGVALGPHMIMIRSGLSWNIHFAAVTFQSVFLDRGCHNW